MQRSVRCPQRTINLGVRLEIDDREERLGRKIRDAEKKWVPFILVVGEKEASEGIYSLRLRNGNEIKDVRLEDISEFFKVLQRDMPFLRSNLNKYMSLQPVFRD
jgi:threonyl-tRNA synthetase